MIIKRTLCALLTFIIVLSVIPGTVWAAESSEAAPENYVQVVKPEEGWGAAGTIELEHCHPTEASLMGENDDGQEYIFLTLNYGNQSRSSEMKGSFEVTEYSNYPIQVYYVDKSRQSHEVTFQCALSVQSGNASISAENGKKWLKTLGKGTAQIHASYLTLDILCRVDIRKISVTSNRTELAYLALNQFVYLDGTDEMKGKTVGNILSTGVPHEQADLSIRVNDKIGATYRSLFSELIWDWKLCDYKKDSSGFYAGTFWNPSAKEYIIAYRGTQPWDLSGDVNADLRIANGQEHRQLDQSINFYKNQSFGGSPVVLTGYSLGGALANYVSALTHTRAVTFNGISSTTSAVNTNTTIFAKNYTGLNNGLKIDYVNPKDGWGQRGVGDSEGSSLNGNLKGGYLDRTYFIHDQSSINGRGTGTQWHFFDQMLAYNPSTGRLYLPCDYVTNPVVRKFSLGTIEYILGSTENDSQLNISSDSGAYVFGGSGNDVIRSAAFSNLSNKYTICGGNGNDIIYSWSSANETYLFFSEHNGIDTINDFSGKDKLELHGYSEMAITDDDGFPYVTIFAPGTSTPIVKLNRNGKGNYTIVNGTYSKTIERIGPSTINSYKSACPVDMLIRDQSGAVVLELNDGVEMNKVLDYGSFSVYEQDGEYIKSAILFNEGYSVELLGIGSGEMSYSNAIVGDGEPVIRAVEHISLETGTVYKALSNVNSDVVLEGDSSHDDVVFYAPESLDVSVTKDTLRYGESARLAAAVFPETSIQGVSWSSSDPGVAVVDEKGTVTAVSAGSVVITAESLFDPSITDTCEITVSDETIPIGTATISGIKDSYVFTGSPAAPELTISLGDYTLLEGTDYELSYENNVDVGTAAVTISGIGYFTGTQSRTFVIQLPTVSEKVNQLLEECLASDVETDRDKAMWFHDWLIHNADYDHTYTEYGPDGVLLKGTGVCQSYADAYSALLTAAGIENMVVISPEMDHAWNIVYIDGVYTHVDCTWDDPNSGGLENHSYFGLGDSEMSQDHIWDTGRYPACQTLPFHADETKLPAPFDLYDLVQGVEFTLLDKDSNIITREDIENANGNVLLVFGRPTCSNTMALLRNLSNWKEVLDRHNVQVIAIMEDASQVSEISEHFDFLCGYDLDVYESWKFNQRIDLTGSYMYPQVVLQNSNGYSYYNSTGYVYEPEKLVATAIERLPESEQAAYSPVQIYTTQAEMKDLIKRALEQQLDVVKVCNPLSHALSDDDVDAALDYINEVGRQYEGSCSWHSPFFGSELVIGLEFEAGEKHTVIWLNGDGTELDRKVYNEGLPEPTTERAPTKADTTSVTFTFKSWKLRSTSGNVKTYEPEFTETPKDQYTVIWLNGDGTELDRKTYNAGQNEPTTTAVPTKADTTSVTFTFKSWKLRSTSGNVKTYEPEFTEATRILSGPWKSEITGNWYDVEGEGTWTFDNNGSLTISGTGGVGSMNDEPPWPYHSGFFDGYPANPGVVNIIISSGISELGGWCAIRHCTFALTLTIPLSVSYIGPEAFQGLYYLEDIYYEGTSEQWAIITRDTGYQSYYPQFDRAVPTVHYANKTSENAGFEQTDIDLDNSMITYAVHGVIQPDWIVYIAWYDARGRMLEAQIEESPKAANTVGINPDADYYQLFLLNRNTFVPVCEGFIPQGAGLRNRQ